MDLSNLKPAAGSTKNRKRIGRGQGSGRGGTATRGNKGAQSRSVINAGLVSKVDRCLYTGAFPNRASKISTVWNIMVLILMICRNLLKSNLYQLLIFKFSWIMDLQQKMN